MSARAEEGGHLDLQISLLAGQEVMRRLEHISARTGIEHAVVDEAAKERGEATAVGDLARDLQVRLPERRWTMIGTDGSADHGPAYCLVA